LVPSTFVYKTISAAISVDEIRTYKNKLVTKLKIFNSGDTPLETLVPY
jgi:uncharacterized membrane protein YjjB (DUF3815 family)